MPISATISRSVQLGPDTPVTNPLLRLLGLPSISLSGSVGTGDIAAGAITPALTSPGAYFYGALTGTNSYSLALSPALGSLANGVDVLGKVGTANTSGSVTLTVDSLAAKNVYHRNGQALKPGDLAANDIVRFRYNSSRNSAVGGWDVMEVLPSATIRPATNATTGTATVQAVVNTPVLTAYHEGTLLLVKVGASLTNTGALTLNCDGLGTRNVLRPGGAALLAGDWVAGQTYLLYDDGTQLILLTKDRPSTIAAGARNLVIQNNTAAPLDKVDITADEVVLKSSNGLPLLVSSVSVTADFTLGVALNGLETGGSRAVSHWWYVWLISDGTNVRAVLEDAGAGDGAVPGTPDLTNAAFAGYIYQGLVGQVRLNATGAGELVQFVQYDRTVWTTEATVLVASDKAAADTWQVLDNTTTTDLTFFRQAVPPNAKTVNGFAGTSDTADNCELQLAAAKADGTLTSTIVAPQILLFTESTIAATYGGYAVACPFNLLPVRGGASRNIQWKRRLDNIDISLSVTGYTF